VNCLTLSRATCCQRTPQMVRYKNDDQCWCGGPSEGKFALQSDIEHWCFKVLAKATTTSSTSTVSVVLPTTTFVTTPAVTVPQSCTAITAKVCCSQETSMVFNSNSQNQCWCSGPGSGEYATQQKINRLCSADPDMRMTLSEAACCQQPTKMWLLKTADVCRCAGPTPSSNFTTQDAIDGQCEQVIKPCSDMQEFQCCAMDPPRTLQNLEDNEEKCACEPPGPFRKYQTQTAATDYCAKLVRPCNDLFEESCCQQSPQRIKVAVASPKDSNGEKTCACSLPYIGGGHNYDESYVKRTCEQWGTT